MNINIFCFLVRFVPFLGLFFLKANRVDEYPKRMPKPVWICPNSRWGIYCVFQLWSTCIIVQYFIVLNLSISVLLLYFFPFHLNPRWAAVMASDIWRRYTGFCIEKGLIKQCLLDKNVQKFDYSAKSVQLCLLDWTFCSLPCAGIEIRARLLNSRPEANNMLDQNHFLFDLAGLGITERKIKLRLLLLSKFTPFPWILLFQNYSTFLSVYPNNISSHTYHLQVWSHWFQSLLVHLQHWWRPTLSWCM